MSQCKQTFRFNIYLSKFPSFKLNLIVRNVKLLMICNVNILKNHKKYDEPYHYLEQDNLLYVWSLTSRRINKDRIEVIIVFCVSIYSTIFAGNLYSSTVYKSIFLEVQPLPHQHKSTDTILQLIRYYSTY